MAADVRKPKSWLWHCRRRLLPVTPDHPRRTSRPLNFKTQINERRTLPASFPLVDAYRKQQLGLKDFSPKSETLWHCSRLRSVALYLWLIVVISVQAIDRLQQYLGFCRALVMVSFRAGLTAWLQNSKKRAERSEVDVWAGHRDYLRSGYLHHRLPVMGWWRHYRDNAVQSPARQKCQRMKLANAAIYWHADASACCARCKIHEGVSWC